MSSRSADQREKRGCGVIPGVPPQGRSPVRPSDGLSRIGGTNNATAATFETRKMLAFTSSRKNAMPAMKGTRDLPERHTLPIYGLETPGYRRVVPGSNRSGEAAHIAMSPHRPKAHWIGSDTFANVCSIDLPQFVEEASGSGCRIYDGVDQERLQRHFL